jgi:ribonuclease-3
MIFRRRPDWLKTVEKRLGYRFKRPDLIEMALTHRSHAHEQAEDPSVHYERIEFLGDALLGFLVSEWLYRDDPTASEGVLTRRRQRVVRTTTLAKVARAIGLDSELRLGRGEERTGGREKPSLLADTFEAVVAAVYLDGGIGSGRAFVRRHLGTVLYGTRDARDAGDDYKTKLQERVQAKLRHTPRYRIVSTSGPAHALEFEVEVLVDGRVIGRGTGSNRKRAEQSAAKIALEGLHDDDG